MLRISMLCLCMPAGSMLKGQQPVQLGLPSHLLAQLCKVGRQDAAEQGWIHQYSTQVRQ